MELRTNSCAIDCRCHGLHRLLGCAMENEDANDALDHLRPPDSNRWLCWYLRPWTSHMGILVLYDRLCKGTFRISIHPSDGLIVFQFLDARQHSLLHSSVETLPGGAFTAPSSMMSALIVVRTLHFQKLAWVGWTALVVGFGLDSLLTPDGNNGVLYGLQIIASIGGGMLFPLSNSPYRPHSWTRT